MIDKINGNGVYDYPTGSRKQKNAVVRAYENTPGTKDAANRKADMSGKDASKQNDQGVILDLSPNAEQQKGQTVQSKASFHWSEALRKFFAPVVKWLKNFWESDNTKPESIDDMESLPPLDSLDNTIEDAFDEIPNPVLDPAAEITDETLPDPSLINKAAKAGDLKQIEQLLTRNGARRPARNSDLLTYYDRRGKIVEMDETQRHRVLFGDKNVLKL